jgi:anti-sigma factor RsiW
MERDSKSQPDHQPTAHDLAAYFDGEVSKPEQVARFESMIREDAGLREQIRTYESIRTHLRRLPKTEAPPYLRKRVMYTMSARGRRMNAVRRATRFLVAGMLVAAAFIVAAGLLWGARFHETELQPIYAAMLADHAKYQPANSDTEMFSDSPSDLETWLSARLDFTPKVPGWDWAELKSGRACSLNKTKVALVRYRCGGEDMSLYIWPIDRPMEQAVSDSTNSPELLTTERGYDIASWSRGDLAYGLVAQRGTVDIHQQVNDMVPR